MKQRQVFLIVFAIAVGFVLAAGTVLTESPGMKQWQKGKGWGWVWGADDEVGALNEMTDDSRLKALRLATRGRVYDLGIVYDRTSYKWPGHSPAEVIMLGHPVNGEVGTWLAPSGSQICSPFACPYSRLQ